jgi:pyrimidine-specific ribonucleoside hydrolase
MHKFIIIVILTGACFFAESCFGNVRYKIIIDTDGAADDLRAICMLLAHSETEILAVTSSEGALIPADASVKILSLLHAFQRGNIPVGTGRNLNITPPMWRRQSKQIEWGDPSGVVTPQKSAKDLITEVLETETGKVTVICLGAFTNLSDALKDKPTLCERIDRVLWYGHTGLRSGSNYDTNKEAAEWVFQSGMNIDIISGVERTFVISNSYINCLASTDTPYANKIVKAHREGVLVPVVASGHMKAWDDLVAVYLYAPELYHSIAKHAPAITIYSLKKSEEEAVKAVVKIFFQSVDRDKSVP